MLQDVSRQHLVAAIEDNLFALFRSFERIPGAIVEDAPRGQLHWTGLRSPWFNGVCRTRLDEDPAAAVAETKAWFRRRGTPFFWWVGPQTRPPDLEGALAAAGLVPFAGPLPGMALDLRELDDRPSPDGLVVEHVRGDALMDVWCETVLAAYGMPPCAGQAWVEASRRIGYDRLPYALYLGLIEGQPAGVSMAFVHAGTVGIYAVGTAPAARRRGVGAELTLVALRAARDAGVGTAILHSTEEGYPLYRSLGFEELCSVERRACLL